MRKLGLNPGDDGKEGKRPKRRALVAVVLGLAFSPIVFEASSLCAAQWRSMNGPIVTVQTPVLDTFAWLFGSIWAIASQTVGKAFHNIPWRPSLVIPLTFAWAGAASLLLRRH